MSKRVFKPGLYRRRLRVVTGPGWARGDLEDDPHRYGIVIRHDGKTVTAVEAEPLRIPWDICTEATGALDDLVGLSLDPDILAPGRIVNSRLQCTHMFDTATLALAHAARGTRLRQYDATVHVETIDGPRDAVLKRDGEIILQWTANATTVLSPAPFAGQNLTRLLVWAREELKNLDDFEAVFILRRAIAISRSRDFNVEHWKDATKGPVGACYVYQPERVGRAKRNLTTQRDNTDTPEALLADMPTETVAVRTSR